MYNSAQDLNQTQAAIAKDQWNDYKTNFQPLEGKFVDEVNNWTSPQNYAKAAGDAAATVDSAFGSAKAQLARTPGMDPSSGAYQAGMTQLGLQQAASSATAQNSARQNVQNQGIAMQENALSLGKGLPATAAATAGSAASGLSNLGSTVAANNARNSSSIGSAVQSVANGVTSYMGSNPSSSGTNSYGFDASSVATPAGLSGVGYTVPAGTAASYLASS
ncbi:hypothetical protein DIE01_16370 [Burkholderia sp. Bp8990]|nr:hypothetical protein DIE01_16370 [Burkholderia sp. Bp8990]